MDKPTGLTGRNEIRALVQEKVAMAAGEQSPKPSVTSMSGKGQMHDFRINTNRRRQFAPYKNQSTDFAPKKKPCALEPIAEDQSAHITHLMKKY